MSAENFAGRLRELRDAAGLTQQQLAERVGMTRDGIAQLETGRRMPTWATVIALSDALQVSCEEFRRAPQEQEPRKPGRPAKHAEEAIPEPAPKRGRGRPKKTEGGSYTDG